MLDALTKKIDAVGRDLCNETRKNLKQKKMSTAGVLEDSIRYTLQEVSEGKFILSYMMVEYGYYQDEGVKGKDPGKVRVNGKRGKQKAPNSRFKFGTQTGRKNGLFHGLDYWIVRRGIAPRTKTGKFMSRAALKYVMSRSIYFQGLKPREFFSDAWNKTLEDAPKELEKALVKDIEKLFIKLIWR